METNRKRPDLDIIVTHYKEDWQVGEKLFMILNLQRGLGQHVFRVTIVNDGEDCHLPDTPLLGLRYPVRQIDIPHGGVSAARNAGLDAAEADWIMFCDFDDTFASIYALRDIFNVLPAEKYNMLHCSLVAEDFTNGRSILYHPPAKQDYVYCHGKLYRRRFLLDNDLRFDTELNFNEDSEFNAVLVTKCHYSTIGYVKSEFPVYAWICRDGSVTHSGREDEAAFGQFRRNLKVTAANEPRGAEFYNGMITRTVYDTWYMVQGNRISDEMKARIMERFVPWVRDKMDRFGRVTDDTLRQIIELGHLELLDQGEHVPDNIRLVRNWVEANISKYYQSKEGDEE